MNAHNVCRICLKGDSNVSPYREFFTEILGFEGVPDIIHLCLWCMVAVNRTMRLVSMARRAQKTLLDSNRLPNDSNTYKRKGLYELSYFYNKPINIIPNVINAIDKESDKSVYCDKENSQIDECGTLKNLNSEQETGDSFEEETIDNKEETKEIKKKCNKKRTITNKYKIEGIYKELQFSVEYLSLEEQAQEIEVRRSSEKYKRMKYRCESCGVGFLTSDVYKEHKLRHEENAGPNICPICRLRFKSHDVLSQHSLAHRRRFTCDVCNTSFKRWAHCVGHRHKCGAIIEYVVCGECSKIFSNKHALSVHTRSVHKKNNEYACNECDRRFSNRQRLTIHMRTHTGVKPFECDSCTKKFATNSSLKAHLASHSDVRQYYCVECDTRYKTKKGLKRHFLESLRHTNNIDTLRKQDH